MGQQKTQSGIIVGFVVHSDVDSGLVRRRYDSLEELCEQYFDDNNRMRFWMDNRDPHFVVRCFGSEVNVSCFGIDGKMHQWWAVSIGTPIYRHQCQCGAVEWEFVQISRYKCDRCLNEEANARLEHELWLEKLMHEEDVLY